MYTCIYNLFFQFIIHYYSQVVWFCCEFFDYFRTRVKDVIEPSMGDLLMSKRFWIVMRIFGWSLILGWFVVYEINLFFNIFQSRVMDLLNGLIGGISTFLVLIGYYMLTRNGQLANWPSFRHRVRYFIERIASLCNESWTNQRVSWDMEHVLPRFLSLGERRMNKRTLLYIKTQVNIIRIINIFIIASLLFYYNPVVFYPNIYNIPRFKG